MVNQPQHPITTPKGAGALTIVLAVLGIFTPFLTGIEAALMFAAIAVLVIGWLYWADFRDAVVGVGNWRPLWGAATAIIVIVGLAGAGVWKAHDQSQPSAPTKPALDASAVGALVMNATSREQPATAPSIQAPVQQRVIIEYGERFPEPSPSPASTTPKAALTPANDPEFEKIISKMKRRTQALTAARPCLDQKYKLMGGLGGLISAAAIKQNVYYDTHNAKAMTTALAEWLPRAREYLEENKAALPDTSAFELANIGDINTGLFPRPGYKAWATLDAKRKALESIMKAVEGRQCEQLAKAAVSDCDGNDNCLTNAHQ